MRQFTITGWWMKDASKLHFTGIQSCLQLVLNHHILSLSLVCPPSDHGHGDVLTEAGFVSLPTRFSDGVYRVGAAV